MDGTLARISLFSCSPTTLSKLPQLGRGTGEGTQCSFNISVQAHWGTASNSSWDLGHSVFFLFIFQKDNILSSDPKSGELARSAKLWCSDREWLLIPENGCAS